MIVVAVAAVAMMVAIVVAMVVVVVVVVVAMVVVLAMVVVAILVLDIRYQGPPSVLLSPHLLGLNPRHGLLAQRRLQGVVELEALRGRHGEVARELARLPVQNR